MKSKKIKCSKCFRIVDIDMEICMNCGAILPTKENMLTKKDLKKMKEI